MVTEIKDSTISVARVRAIYDRAYSNPGLMGTHLDKEYSQVTKTTLIDMCRNGVPHRILDLGTGDGDLWQFAPRQWEWHAIDISPIGVRRTIDRFSNVLGAAAIAENLPYPTGYFGVVIAADTVEHVFDLRAALLEVRRVLVNGGYFALSVPTPNSLPKWAYNRFIGQRPSPILFAKLLYTILARAVLFGHPAFQPIDRDLSVDEWHELITQAGFVIEQSVSWPQPPLKAIVHLFGARAGAEQ